MYADQVDVSEFDDGLQIWWALMWDLWEQDKEQGMDFLVRYVAKVLVESGHYDVWEDD